MEDRIKTQQHSTADPIRLHPYEFKSLANNSPDVIIRFDKYLNFIYANPAIKIPTGISASNIIGRQLSDLSLSPL